MYHPIKHGLDTGAIAAKPLRTLTINPIPKTALPRPRALAGRNWATNFAPTWTEFNKQGSGADLATDGEDRYRVQNSSSGLELALTADFDNHTVRYDYSAINQRSAGVPEGGILSMRQSRRGDRGVLFRRRAAYLRRNPPGSAGAAVVSETISCVASGAAGTQKAPKAQPECGLHMSALRFPAWLRPNRA